MSATPEQPTDDRVPAASCHDRDEHDAKTPLQESIRRFAREAAGEADALSGLLGVKSAELLELSAAVAERLRTALNRQASDEAIARLVDCTSRLDRQTDRFLALRERHARKQ